MRSLVVSLWIVIAIISCLLTTIGSTSGSPSILLAQAATREPRGRAPPPPPCTTPLGSINGWANGIPAYSNCNDDTTTFESSFIDRVTHEQILEEDAPSQKHALPIGMKWQCVEYARRYMMTIHQVAFGDVDSAWQIWGTKNLYKSKDIAEESKPSGFFSRFQNGHSTVPPDVHDVLIWEKEEPLAPHGHVGIVTGIHEDPQDGQVYVEIGEQNWGSSAWDGRNYSRRLKLIETSQSRFVQQLGGGGGPSEEALNALGGKKSMEEANAVEIEAPNSRRSATSVRGGRRGIRSAAASVTNRRRRREQQQSSDKVLPLGARKRKGVASFSVDGAPLHSIPAGIDARDLASNPNFLNKAAYGIPDLSSGGVSSSASLIPEVPKEQLEHPDTVISSVGSSSHPRYFLEDTIGLHIVGWLRPGTRDIEKLFNSDFDKPRVEVDPSGERRKRLLERQQQEKDVAAVESASSSSSRGQTGAAAGEAPPEMMKEKTMVEDDQPSASIPIPPPPPPPKKSPSPSKRVESTSAPRKESDL